MRRLRVYDSAEASWAVAADNARRLVTRKRVDGHVRVSRIGGRPGDGYISPEVEREQIEAFASLMGVEIDCPIPRWGLGSRNCSDASAPESA